MEEFNEAQLNSFTKVVVMFERSESIAKVGAMRGRNRHRSPLHHMRPGICRTTFSTPSGQRVYFESQGRYEKDSLVIDHVIRSSGRSTSVTRDRKWALELLRSYGGYFNRLPQ